MRCRGAAQVCRCPAGRHKNLFKVFFGLLKCLAGMGCKAQRLPIACAIGKRCNTADRPASHLPEGLE